MRRVLVVHTVMTVLEYGVQGSGVKFDFVNDDRDVCPPVTRATKMQHATNFLVKNGEHEKVMGAIFGRVQKQHATKKNSVKNGPKGGGAGALLFLLSRWRGGIQTGVLAVGGVCETRELQAIVLCAIENHVVPVTVLAVSC